MNSVAAMKLSPYYKVRMCVHTCVCVCVRVHACAGVCAMCNVHTCVCSYRLRDTLSFQVFEEDAITWEDKLNKINAVFDVWIDVQRRWVYLEGIFTGSADIKHLLPIESQRFSG